MGFFRKVKMDNDADMDVDVVVGESLAFNEGLRTLTEQGPMVPVVEQDE